MGPNEKSLKKDSSSLHQTKQKNKGIAFIKTASGLPEGNPEGNAK